MCSNQKVSKLLLSTVEESKVKVVAWTSIACSCDVTGPPQSSWYEEGAVCGKDVMGSNTGWREDRDREMEIERTTVWRTEWRSCRALLWFSDKNPHRDSSRPKRGAPR
ncbi:hypothetical protein SRHO_G00305180 [Serrasalmus rhombeus]